MHDHRCQWQPLGASLWTDFHDLVETPEKPFEMVGDKLREVLRSDDIAIRWYDEKAGLLKYLYACERGKRVFIEPQAPRPGGAWSRVLGTRKAIVGNTRADVQATGTVPGTTEETLSFVFVPILVGDRVVGSVSVESLEREYAFGPSEVRLVETIATPMQATAMPSHIVAVGGTP